MSATPDLTTKWLIERNLPGKPAEWWSEDASVEWTNDANLAAKYSNEFDAQTQLDYLRDYGGAGYVSYRVSSHGWHKGPPLAEPSALDVNVSRNHIIEDAVNRFLGWDLPSDFHPDCGITFDGRGMDDRGYEKTWPIGTNLFTADQAKAMFEHCLYDIALGAPTPPAPSAPAAEPVPREPCRASVDVVQTLPVPDDAIQVQCVCCRQTHYIAPALRSLLRAPITGPGQFGPCHCPPDECQAPVIMGRQTPCLRAAPAAAPPEPAADADALNVICDGDPVALVRVPRGVIRNLRGRLNDALMVLAAARDEAHAQHERADAAEIRYMNAEGSLEWARPKFANLLSEPEDRPIEYYFEAAKKYINELESGHRTIYEAEAEQITRPLRALIEQQARELAAKERVLERCRIVLGNMA